MSSPPATATPIQLSNTSAFASLPSSSYHYGADLWDDASSVAQQSEESKQWLTKMSKFLKEKAELDREYAKSLKKLVLKLGIPDVPRVQDIPIPPSAVAAAAVAVQLGSSGSSSTVAPPAAVPTTTDASLPAATPQPPIVDPRSFDRFQMAFRNLHLTLATNFEILSAKIVEQVSKPLAIHKDAHALHAKRLLTELEKYTQSYQKHLDSLLSSRAACQKACQDSEALRRRLDAALSGHSLGPAGGVNVSNSGSGGGGVGDKPESISSLKADSANLVKKALKADGTYIQAVKNMRGFRMQTDANLSHLLDQFEQLEQSKLTSGKEVLSHYLIIQQQMFTSNLKNLSAVQTVIDKVNPHVDLQYFIMLHRSGKLPIALPEYQVFRGHPNYAKMMEQEVSGATQNAAPGDLSAFSSAQFEGDSDDSHATHSPLAPIQPVAAKAKSGWGWLTNTIANVVNTASAKGGLHARTSIDHDSESVLTRGSNYYERSAASIAASTTGLNGDDDDSSEVISASPLDPNRDEDEEKTPERKATEQVLADMFDAVTGRVSVASPTAASPSSSSASSSASNTISTYSVSRERDLTPAEDIQARELFATSEGRKSFSSVLNRQRNTSGGLRVSPTALDRLARLVRLFLDEAASAMHVSPAQLVMIMSQSFFTSTTDDVSPDAQVAVAQPTSPNPQKERRTYLLALIKDHPIWSDMRFWEEAFMDALSSKIRKSAAAKVHKWHSDLEQAESLHTRKQVCFSTLTTFIHNLSEFSVDSKSVVEFAEKLASINELEPEQMMMLRTMPVYGEVEISQLDPSVASNLIQAREAAAEAHQGALGEFESINAEIEDNVPQGILP